MLPRKLVLSENGAVSVINVLRPNNTLIFTQMRVDSALKKLKDGTTSLANTQKKLCCMDCMVISVFCRRFIIVTN